MIVDSLLLKLTEYISWLYQKAHLTRTELLIVLVLLVLLLMFLRRRQKKNIRTVGPENLLDRPSVIGAKLGHGLRRHGLGISRAGQLTFAPGRDKKQQNLSIPDGRPEESHEQAGRAQREIIRPRQLNEEMATKVTELAAANEELRRGMEESRNAAEGLERKVAELTATNERLRAQVAQLKETGQKAETRKYEDEHRVVDNVRQKFCRKCGCWKEETEFHRNASRKDGLGRWCKVCKTKAAKKARERRTEASEVPRGYHDPKETTDE
jgi:hypothetical protein